MKNIKGAVMVSITALVGWYGWQFSFAFGTQAESFMVQFAFSWGALLFGVLGVAAAVFLLDNLLGFSYPSRPAGIASMVGILAAISSCAFPLTQDDNPPDFLYFPMPGTWSDDDNCRFVESGQYWSCD